MISNLNLTLTQSISETINWQFFWYEKFLRVYKIYERSNLWRLYCLFTTSDDTEVIVGKISLEKGKTRKILSILLKILLINIDVDFTTLVIIVSDALFECHMVDKEQIYVTTFWQEHVKNIYCWPMSIVILCIPAHFE